MFDLSPEERKPPATSSVPDDEGWEFIRNHGEMDKSDRKQLQWVYHHINLAAQLVQKALDSLRPDHRYDLTSPTPRSSLCLLLGTTLCDRARQVRGRRLWVRSSLGDFPLSWRRWSMPLHQRFGLLRGDLDFKCVPVLHEHGSIVLEETKKQAFADVG